MASANEVTEEYATVFEWVCLKGFQSLFPAEQGLNDNDKEPIQISGWFFNSPVFGAWPLFEVSSQVRWVPNKSDYTGDVPPSKLLEFIELEASRDRGASLKSFKFLPVLVGMASLLGAPSAILMSTRSAIKNPSDLP